jgi:diaminopimelate decarboxylase
MHRKNNQLYLGKFSVKSLAKKFGTPLYVYEANTIRQKYFQLIKSITYHRLKIHYACKANSNPLVLKLLRRLGAGIETVSRGEIELSFQAGFKPEQILFSSTSVSVEELIFVANKGIMVNLDSLSQIELYGKIKPGSKVGLRLNQGIGAGHHSHVVTGGVKSKFGIPIEHLPHAKKLAAKYKLQVTNLHQHIGSNILDEKVLLEAFDKLLETAEDFPGLESLNFGGGFGVPYSPKEKALNLKYLGLEMTRKMDRFCQVYGKKLTIILEPGRFLVAESGVLLATIMEIKKNPNRTFVGLNTGFNHLIRPAMYGSYHEIINTSRTKEPIMQADIVGNICESGDVFAHARKISGKIGDVLAILNAGAYGYVMASKYNSRPLPKEIMV